MGAGDRHCLGAFTGWPANDRSSSTGYAWLDRDDLYGVRAVGLYLARHGALLSRPLDHYAVAMLNGHDVDVARVAFLDRTAHTFAEEKGLRDRC